MFTQGKVKRRNLTREMLTKKIHAAQKDSSPAVEFFLWSAPRIKSLTKLLTVTKYILCVHRRNDYMKAENRTRISSRYQLV